MKPTAILILVLSFSAGRAQDIKQTVPKIIGAQIMINAGEDPERWIKMLAKHDMPLARIFVPHDEAGLRQCDALFRAAEKHGVKITATLGGPPTPDNATWIQQVVERYRASPALDSWILMNEPGSGPPAHNEIAERRFRQWLERKYGATGKLNETWGAKFESFANVKYEPEKLTGTWSNAVRFIDWYTFGREHLSWHLNWIAEQVRRADTKHPTHVNPNGLVGNHAARAVDLPSWRPFLDSLGASAHQSWQFFLLGREQHLLGLSYICDLIKGAIEPKGFWITEFQGGNNLYSGSQPLYPSPAEISQHLWGGFGAGAERMIFWQLNNRLSGTESGEWSLLDFQGEPSERLRMAQQVAQTLKREAKLFDSARAVESRVVILLSLQTMTLQHRIGSTQPANVTERGVARKVAGRDREAHVLSALADYQILHELGIPARLKYMHDFDWRATTKQPRLAILPHVSAMSVEQARDVEVFVRNGNTALLTGLTGVWDPENKFWPLEKFPLEDLLGATLQEIRTSEDADCAIQLRSPKTNVPCHLWTGDILNRSAEPLATTDGRITAVRKRAGRGEAIWIPALVDLAAWIGDNKPLSQFISGVADPFVRDLPFRFVQQQPGCLMRTLTSGSSYLTFVMNATKEPRQCVVRATGVHSPRMIWGEAPRPSGNEHTFALRSHGSAVTAWSAR
jgi:beta-galactosidase